ncbi:MAG: carboxypeptidase regulatory-like domain-containing protein [Bryobacterales bacterium]|nr:carboxypeptidase regulatory-like domain-containing protein [Bryobacterales bacterium]
MSSKPAVTRVAILGLAFALAAPAAESISGRVWRQEGEHRLPMAKVLVRLVQEGRGPDPVMARSDAEGRWSIAGPLEGRYFVSASRAGYYVALADGTARSSVLVDCAATCGPVDFELVRGGAVNGVVEDDQGEPLQNVAIALRREGEDEERPETRSDFGRGPSRFGRGGPGGSWGGDEVRSDDMGRFRVAGLQPGRYSISADGNRRPGAVRYSLAGEPTIEVEAGEELDMRVAMQRSVTPSGLKISGVVQGVDLSGGRRMLFVSEMRDAASGVAPRFTQRTTAVREDGSFEVAGLTPARYSFTLHQDGGRGPMMRTALGPVDVRGDMTGLTLTPVPTVRVAGRFELDSDGEARGLMAQLDPLDGSPSINVNAGRMDRDFAERAPAGLYRIRVRSRDWFLDGVELNGEAVDPERTPILGDTTELVIHVSDRFARVEGLVRAPSPEAASPRYRVTLTSEGAEGRPDEQSTDQNGGFVFERITPGEYRICARPYDAERDAACAIERRFPVEAGAEIELGLTLER